MIFILGSPLFLKSYCCSDASVDYFNAPSVKPFTMNRWPKNISRSAGMVERMAAAAISPCRISYCWANLAIPTGIGALLMKSESLLRVDVIMVCLIVLSLMGLLFERVFARLEEKMTRTWR